MDLEIPVAWERSAAAIARHRWRKILVLGAVDRGKSTYCGYLSRYLLDAGWRVAVVDADIGQKDIGPPATLTLGYPEAHQRLSEVTPAAMYFVGSVTPVGHLLPMVVGSKRLLDAAQAPFVLINTTGLVHGVGRVLKGYKIEALQPEVLVAIARDAELEPLLRAYRNVRILRLPPAAAAVAKTPEQRREARAAAFRRYFQNARDHVFPARRLIFQRRLPPIGAAPNLLCGLTDRRGRGLGLALLRHWDARQGLVTLHTPVPGRAVCVVQVGDLYLGPDGYELGRDSGGR